MQLFFVFWIVSKLMMLNLTLTEAHNVPVLMNCSLVTDQNIATSLQKAFDKDKHVIYATVSIAGETAFSEPHVKTVLDPTKWIFTKDETARSILLFNEHFLVMSLYTLSFSVNTIRIEVQQQPKHCLSNRSVYDVEHAIRLFLLDLIDREKESTENVHICNKDILEIYNGTAEIQTFCCGAGLNTGLHCKELRPGIWFLTLRVSVFVLVVLIWGACVYARPLCLYDRVIKVKVNTKQNFILNATKTPSNIRLNQPAADSSDSIQIHMNNANDDVKTFKIKTIILNVQTRKLSKPDTDATGFFKFFWDFLFWCDIRDNSESTSSCCDEECFYRCGPSWHSILSFMKFPAVVSLIFLPVILRVVFIFEIQSDLNRVNNEMKFRNLTLTYKMTLDEIFDSLGAWLEVGVYGSLFIFQIAMLSFETCEEVCTCCCFDPLDTLFKQKHSQRNICNMYMRIALHRCKCLKFGILNICFLPFSLFFAMIYVIYRIFPTVYVCFHMFKSCVTFCTLCETKKKKKKKKKKKSYNSLDTSDDDDTSNDDDTPDDDCNVTNIIAVVVTFFVCFVLGAFCFFLSGGILFYVQCGVYTLTGIILNYNSVIAYIGPFIFILLYGHSKIQAVHKQLQIFAVSINKALLEAFSDLNQFVPQEKETDTEVYACNMKRSDPNPASIIFEKDRKKLKINGGILFFEKSGDTVKPFISKPLLYHLSSLSHPSCPGSPLWLYLKVVSQVLGRAIILGFILNIILALGEGLSSAMKTLFLFLTGYIVSWIKQFYVNSHPMSSQEIGYWTDVFVGKTKVLDDYDEIWDVSSYDADTSQVGSYSIETET